MVHKYVHILLNTDQILKKYDNKLIKLYTSNTHKIFIKYSSNNVKIKCNQAKSSHLGSLALYPSAVVSNWARMQEVSFNTFRMTLLIVRNAKWWRELLARRIILTDCVGFLARERLMVSMLAAVTFLGLPTLGFGMGMLLLGSTLYHLIHWLTVGCKHFNFAAMLFWVHPSSWQRPKELLTAT